MMDPTTKKILAYIMDRCDNSLYHLSKSMKNKKYIDFFENLAEIIHRLSEEEKILWWKRYSKKGKVNYKKIKYNIEEIKKALNKLSEEMRGKILEKLKEGGHDEIIKDNSS